MASNYLSLAYLLLLAVSGNAIPIVDIPIIGSTNISLANSAASCFPALGFSMPSWVPSSTNGWWCDPSTEYAFVGFSYEVTECQSKETLKREFKDIRNKFSGRYVRLYGACDRAGFYDDVIDAAWEATVGVHALIWFGFDNSPIWQTRRNQLFLTLHTNPKAKFVTRLVQFGSEPLYDDVLDVGTLASQVWAAKANLQNLGIPVTISEMASEFLGAGLKRSQLVYPTRERQEDIHVGGSSLVFSQPTNVGNEADYFNLLDSKCEFFKTVAGGGVGWFAHIYADGQEPGYGIYDVYWREKFWFRPRTRC
uniref:Putative B-(1-6) glucan synthase n=1 Tax=Flammulina velutipes TaxID=38945 RepID=G8A551_FLAVE|nr:putative B-(1-6) glucan synthase [Flammulina velutipes]